MPNLTFGTDSASFTSIPASTTPYNIGSPLALGGSRIVESITLDLGNSGVTSPANASAAIWSGSSPYAIIYRSANLEMANSNRYRTFAVGANGLYLTNATYYFGVSRASSSYRISVGQQSSTTGVSRTSGDQAVSTTNLGTLNTSMSSRRLTGYITYRDATVPDEPSFTIRQGYGSVIIEDISTATDAALPLTQWQYYRSPGSGSWTNVAVSGDTLGVGNGTFTLTGLSVGTEYSIYLRVLNAHGVSPQTLPDVATPYGLPFMVDEFADYDDVTDTVTVSFTGDENYDEDGIDYYHIYRSVNGGTYAYIHQTDATETLNGEYFDTNVSVGNTYTYRIYPHNRAGFGGYGQTDGVVVIEPPSTVQSLTVTNVGVDSISISWSPPSFNGGSAIQNYTILLDAEEVVTANVTNFTITGLVPNTLYLIEVIANNTLLSSDPSGVEVTTLGGLPRVYNALTSTWDYGIIKHYDNIAEEWKTISIKYFSQPDENPGTWETYNS